METRRELLRARLLALGFDDVRFARAGEIRGERLRAWIAAGHHADMHWMERTADKRISPRLVLPDVATVIMLGINYWPGESGAGVPPARSGGVPAAAPVWARYSLYSDYHDTVKPGLETAGRVIEELFGVGPRDYRYYVDAGPVLERAWAARAGLGFQGKNAMLISRKFGNWLFLAGILARIDIEPDPPLTRAAAVREEPGLLCGKCTRCLDACPTQAFTAPGVVDARRCISYQTIENRGIIPRDLRAGIGDRIYGCDICAEVCPWNRFAQASRSLLLTPRAELRELALIEILELTPEKFAAIFRKTAIKRIKLAGFLRNACIVAGNTRARECGDALLRLATPGGESGPPAVVRAHAVWALARLGELARLAAARAAETDPLVQSEYAAETV
ncbi:uncharacterized Fe-S protein [Opitutaceae bacterium TAV1]|nr:uncharacterized Fe-S protein [Opitutaceae bacterium TAV1]